MADLKKEKDALAEELAKVKKSEKTFKAQVQEMKLKESSTMN